MDTGGLLKIRVSLFITFVLLSFSIFGESCLTKSLATKVSRVEGSKISKYWENDQEVIITINGKNYPLTYSFDSEFSYADTLLLLEKDPKNIEKLNELFAHVNRSQTANTGLFTKARSLFGKPKVDPNHIDYLNIPVEKILEADRLMSGASKPRSPKQFFSFGGLRKGIPTDKETYAITELNPRLYDFFVSDMIEPLLESKHKGNNLKFLNFSHAQASDFTEKYRQLMKEVMVDDMKIPVKATIDSGYLEFPHSSYETIPSQWNKVIKEDINDPHKWTSSHMHIGIPAEIGKPKMDAITRAVEARIILEHAMSPSFGKKLYATSYSSLRGDPKSAKKFAGVIRMNYKRHTEPFPMHDLEVRNYLSFKEGQNHLALAARLAQDHEKLRLIDNFSALDIKDPETSNLNGALKYVGKLALDNGNAEIGAEFIRLADEIEAAGEITLTKRKEVQKLLKSKEAMKLLNPEFFLEAN